MGLLGRHYAMKQLYCDTLGQWWLVPAEGERFVATLHADSRLGAGVLWLTWDGLRGRHRVLLLKPQLSAETWRRLRVRLHLLASPALKSRE